MFNEIRNQENKRGIMNRLECFFKKGFEAIVRYKCRIDRKLNESHCMILLLSIMGLAGKHMSCASLV